VFTGIGALCWLPSVRRWAEVVATLLAPGGRLFIREGHPVLWALADPLPDGRLELDLPYVEREEPLVWDEAGTYVETDHVFENTVTHEWNHGLGEIVTALLDQGLRLDTLVEHDSVPWDPFPGGPRSCRAGSTGSGTARGGSRTATRSARREPRP
jgi:hypothetical protein